MLHLTVASAILEMLSDVVHVPSWDNLHLNKETRWY
jgi:hypothetical protein